MLPTALLVPRTFHHSDFAVVRHLIVCPLGHLLLNLLEAVDIRNVFDARQPLRLSAPALPK